MKKVHKGKNKPTPSKISTRERKHLIGVLLGQALDGVDVKTEAKLVAYIIKWGMARAIKEHTPDELFIIAPQDQIWALLNAMNEHAERTGVEPDAIATELLKHLGPSGISRLVN